jgi:hypothetical protein
MEKIHCTTEGTWSSQHGCYVLPCTYCATIQQHCATLGRTAHVVNLDPAAEDIAYTPSVDLRELISLEDVMEELQLGPNGGSSIAWSEQTDPFPSSEADPTGQVPWEQL